MNYSSDNSQNIINATTAYVKKAVLPVAKTYMDPSIKDAIDFTVIRNCLLNMPKHRLMTSVFIENSSEVVEQNRETVDKVINIDDAGLMSRILFREYSEWGNILSGKLKNDKYKKESKDFLEFLYNITSRDYDEEVPLQFISENIKIGVLLVARPETYQEYEEKPYVRRIREGFSKGITTFYLLARNEKVDILENVYAKLIETGSFNLLNGPKTFKDRQGRENICYCIEVNKDGSMAKSVQALKEAVGAGTTIEGVVTNVNENGIRCDYNGISIIINRANISSVANLNLFHFYQRNMTIEILPINFNDGKAEGSLLNTKSNPKQFIDNNFAVGTEVDATIESISDQFVFMSIHGTSTVAESYRKDITTSIFKPLDTIFSVGATIKGIIYDIDYVNNKLYIQSEKLDNPWDSIRFEVGEKYSCKVELKTETCVITEIEDGIKGILPFSEMSWIKSEIPNLKSRIKVGNTFDSFIKTINRDEHIVILTQKKEPSPYQELFNTYGNSDIKVRIEKVLSQGIVCSFQNKYTVFVPLRETHIGSRCYKVGNKQLVKVKIIDLAKDKKSLIGSLRPFITPPLTDFLNLYKEGQSLSHLHPTLIKDKVVGYDIICKQIHKIYPAILPISEVSNICNIGKLTDIFTQKTDIPLLIKEINLQDNKIILSLKDLLKQNEERISILSYSKEYVGFVIGQIYSDYIVIVENVWIEGKIIHSSKNLQPGKEVQIRVASKRQIPEFVLE